MSEVNPRNVDEDKSKIFKNGYQSAINYVQSAVENVSEATQDATQNLVNQVMKNTNTDNKKNRR